MLMPPTPLTVFVRIPCVSIVHLQEVVRQGLQRNLGFCVHMTIPALAVLPLPFPRVRCRQNSALLGVLATRALTYQRLGLPCQTVYVQIVTLVSTQHRQIWWNVQPVTYRQKEM